MAEMTPLADQPAWMADAACRGTNPDLWFPGREAAVIVKANVAQARATCNRCPVAGPCLDYALSRPDIIGIWGGTTGEDRRQIRRRRRTA